MTDIMDEINQKIQEIGELAKQNKFLEIPAMISEPFLKLPAYKAKVIEVFTDVDMQILDSLVNRIWVTWKAEGEEAFIVLSTIGDPRAIPSVIKVFGEQFNNSGSIADGIIYNRCYTIGKNTGKNAIVPILQEMENWHEKKAVLNLCHAILCEIATPEFYPQIAQNLESKHPLVRDFSARVLQKFQWLPENETQKITYLIETNAWDQLPKANNLAVTDRLMDILKKDDFFQADKAIWILGEVGDERAVKFIVEHLKNAGMFQGAKRSTYETALIDLAKKHRETVIAALSDDNKKVKKIEKNVRKKI